MRFTTGRFIATATALAVLLVSTPAASSRAFGAPEASVMGALVEVISDDRSILLRVETSEGIVVLRRFQVSDSARIRVYGAVARFADIVVGQMARVEYVRMDGRTIAEEIDVMDAVPASGAAPVSAREKGGVESRRRYLEDVASTLDVLEESIEELARRSEQAVSSEELARRGAVVEDLEKKLAQSRAVLDSLSATSSQDAWRRGVDELNAALDALNTAHRRGWSRVVTR